MQSITVIGHVGQNAKVTEVNGRFAINFSVAANESYKDKEGVKVTKTTWYSCTKWVQKNGSKEVAKFLQQGTQVAVQGTPSVRIFEGVTQKGPQASIDIDVKLLELLQSAKKEDKKPDEKRRTVEGGGIPENENFTGE